jgi:hypothetical protein
VASGFSRTPNGYALVASGFSRTTRATALSATRVIPLAVS